MFIVIAKPLILSAEHIDNSSKIELKFSPNQPSPLAHKDWYRVDSYAVQMVLYNKKIITAFTKPVSPDGLVPDEQTVIIDWNRRVHFYQVSLHYCRIGEVQSERHYAISHPIGEYPIISDWCRISYVVFVS